MKKHLLLFVFAFAALALQAQNGEMYSIFFHTMHWDDFGIESVAQQRDNDIIAATHIGMNGSNPYEPPILLGNVFYKMSPTALCITDSLYVADSLAPDYFYSQDPQGDGSILVNIEYAEEVDSTYIRICHFPDNNFHINHDEDVMAPLCEGYATGSVSTIDCRGDLILQYYKEIDWLNVNTYAARLGIDGTLKHQALIHENETLGASRLQVLKESPLQYFQWGFSGTYNHSWQNLSVYVLDSLFHKNPIVISSSLGNNEYLYVGSDTEVIPAGGDNVLVAAKYVCEMNPQNPMENEYGVVIAKYDLRTMQQKGYIVFNDYPGIYRIGQCLGIQMMTDGTVYFLYKEEGYPEESFIALKMDTDLNVEWKRFCKTDNIILSWFSYHILSEDEQGEEKSIAWIGRGSNPETNKDGLTYLFLTHDGTVDVNEGGMEVRPYGYYPNPVKEQLQMQFSPDVQPAQVELYDLQGRLVCRQNKAFESIDMSQLPTGTYTMRVTMEDGKTYTDKVVKE